jgi:hypothetical protein
MPEEAKTKPEVRQAAAATGLTAEDIVKIVEAARRPIKTDQEIREAANKEAERASMREIENRRLANRAAEQNGCQHEHETGVGTPVVYVASLNRLYCQHCHLWMFQTVSEAAQNGSNVSPEKHPALWNRFFSRAYASGMA